MRRKDCPAEFIKECLAQALFHIMENKNFENITVSEICKVAGFGRTTYYHYYTNRKEELITYILTKEWNRVIPTVGEDDSKRPWVQSIIEVFYAYRKYITLLYQQNLLEIVMDVTFQGIKRTNKAHLGSNYAIAFLAGSYYGILREWVMNGFDVSPSEIMVVLEKFVRE